MKFAVSRRFSEIALREERITENILSRKRGETGARCYAIGHPRTCLASPVGGKNISRRIYIGNLKLKIRGSYRRPAFPRDFKALDIVLISAKNPDELPD